MSRRKPRRKRTSPLKWLAIIVLIVLVGVLLAGMTALPKSQWWRDAMLAPPFETAVIAAKPWLPAEVSKRIQYR